MKGKNIGGNYFLHPIKFLVVLHYSEFYFPKHIKTNQDIFFW